MIVIVTLKVEPQHHKKNPYQCPPCPGDLFDEDDISEGPSLIMISKCFFIFRLKGNQRYPRSVSDLPGFC